MANTIRIKRRASGNAGAPAALANAELAFNEVDDILYYGKGDSGGMATTIQAIGGNGLLSLKAPLASPTFTGNPQAPTPTAGDNDTSIATTAFVNAEIAADAAPLAHVGGTGAAHGAATTSVNGFMSSTDKTAIDNLFAADKTQKYFYAAPNAATGAGSFRAIVASDIPTLNQNTTGTASNVTGTVAIANGGTGQTTAQAAMNALAGGVTNGQFLKGNGTNVVLSAIAVADVSGAAPLASPTLTGTPAAPTASAGTNTTQIATTAFVATAVDAARTGLDVKASVRVATTGAGTMVSSFANGQVVDGVTLVTGDRILIKDQGTVDNGIYTVNASGAPTRALDADSNTEVTAGMFTFVEEGTTNADSGWVATNNGTITLGSTVLAFAQFSGAGTIVAGAGLTKTGSTLDVVTANSSRIVVNADSIDLATVTQTDTSGSAGINFVQSVTKDSYGRTSGRVLADVRAATTALPGIVQLYDNIDSTSTTLALTANQGKALWEEVGFKIDSAPALVALGALNLVADRLPYANGTNTATLTTFTAFARTLLDDADAATAQTTLGIGNMTFDGGTF